MIETMRDNKISTIKKLLIITTGLLINSCFWALIVSWVIYYAIIYYIGVKLEIIFFNLVLTYIFSSIGLVYYSNSNIFDDISQDSENKKYFNNYILDEMIIGGFIYSTIFALPQIILNQYSAFIGLFHYRKIFFDNILLGAYLFFCITIVISISIIYRKRKFAKNVVVITLLISALFALGYFEYTITMYPNDRTGLFHGTIKILSLDEIYIFNSHNFTYCAYFISFCMIIAFLIYEFLFHIIFLENNSTKTIEDAIPTKKNEAITISYNKFFVIKVFCLVLSFNLVIYNVVRFYFPASYKCNKNMLGYSNIVKRHNRDNPDKMYKTFEEMKNELIAQHLKFYNIDAQNKDKEIDFLHKRSNCPYSGVYSLINNGNEDVMINCSYHGKLQLTSTFY